MICTSCYKNFKADGYKTYSISGNRGKDANYDGEVYSALAPKLSFWKVWHDNIGILSEEENTRYYVEQYYLQVLSKLDPEKVFLELDNSVLLCYEDNDEFCHRHIVAAWFKLLLNEEIPEIKITHSKNIEYIDRPDYIIDYLADVMRKHKNMRGLTSLRAVYLLEKSDYYFRKAVSLKQLDGQEHEAFKSTANQLRYKAYDIDDSDNQFKLVKVSKK